MPLLSNLFRDDDRLNACLIDHASHVTQGAAGEHVGKIQVALIDLDGLTIDQVELDGKRYGPSTAAAVLAYKQERNIINTSYQTQADNIVGKMTIAALDNEMLAKQETPQPVVKIACGRVCACEHATSDERAALARALLVAPVQARSSLGLG